MLTYQINDLILMLLITPKCIKMLSETRGPCNVLTNKSATSHVLIRVLRCQIAPCPCSAPVLSLKGKEI